MDDKMDDTESKWEGSEETQKDVEEQRVLFAALDSFYQYEKTAHYNTTHTRRQAFYALPREHIKLLSGPPFNFLDTLNQVDDALDLNAELSLNILQSGLDNFGLSHTKTESSDDKTKEWRGKATSIDLEKARGTLRQLYRDWSAEGASEREACYGPIIKALVMERSKSNTNLRILVPGAGLGRLVFDLCHAGFNVEGNEISYHQLLASAYILNRVPAANTHTLYPWVHSFSNHESRASHLKSVQIPDIHPATALASVKNAGEMSMSASDFLLLYGHEDQKDSFDAIATLFFLDTAPNVIRYFETIKNCLRQGGLIVNFGPLLWHFENNAPGKHGQEPESLSEEGLMGIADPGAFELTNDEVLALVDKLGFTVEQSKTGILAPYIQDPSSMLHHTYQASFWVARKR